MYFVLIKKTKTILIFTGRYAVRYGKVAGDALKKQMDSLPSPAVSIPISDNVNHVFRQFCPVPFLVNGFPCV